MGAPKPTTESIIQRFLSKFSKRKNQCWMWSGGIANGYGSFSIGKKKFSAHRISFEIFVNKDFNKTLYVCHKCDVPLCVNPDHLFLGTQQENVNDREQKGRGGSKKIKGELHWNNKVTKIKVLAIRKEYNSKTIPMWELARKYNITVSAVWSIINHRTWKGI